MTWQTVLGGVAVLVVVVFLVWWFFIRKKKKEEEPPPPAPLPPLPETDPLLVFRMAKTESASCDSSKQQQVCVKNSLLVPSFEEKGNVIWSFAPTDAVVAVNEVTLQALKEGRIPAEAESLSLSTHETPIVGLAPGQITSDTACNACLTCPSGSSRMLGQPWSYSSSGNLNWITPYACQKTQTPGPEPIPEPGPEPQPEEIKNLLKLLGLRLASTNECAEGPSVGGDLSSSDAVICVMNGREVPEGTGAGSKLFSSLPEDAVVGLAVSTLISMASGQSSRNPNFVLPSPFDPCPEDPQCEKGVNAKCCRTNVGFAEGKNLTSQQIMDQCQSDSQNVKCYPCAKGALAVPGGSWEDLRQRWWTSYICSGMMIPKVVVIQFVKLNYNSILGIKPNGDRWISTDSLDIEKRKWWDDQVNVTLRQPTSTTQKEQSFVLKAGESKAVTLNNIGDLVEYQLVLRPFDWAFIPSQSIKDNFCVPGKVGLDKCPDTLGPVGVVRYEDVPLRHFVLVLIGGLVEINSGACNRSEVVPEGCAGGPPVTLKAESVYRKIKIPIENKTVKM